MNSQKSKINILIIGATGTLGTLLTRHCIAKPNVLVNILVRDPQKNKELTQEVEKAGGKVFKGDVTQPESVKRVSKGMHTIVFTLPSFGENVIIEGQLAIIEDAVANGVQRVVPCEFGENIFNFSEEEIKSCPPFYDRKIVRDRLKNIPIKVLTIGAGVFLDTLFQVYLGKDFSYWGNGDRKIQITSYEDTAEFTACAIARENEAGDRVYVAHYVSLNELATIYNKVRGAAIAPNRLGSLDDLRAKSKEVEEKGENSSLLRLFTIIYDDRATFVEANNKDYPEITITSIEDFIAQRPEINFSKVSRRRSCNSMIAS